MHVRVHAACQQTAAAAYQSADRASPCGLGFPTGWPPQGNQTVLGSSELLCECPSKQDGDCTTFYELTLEVTLKERRKSLLPLHVTGYKCWPRFQGKIKRPHLSMGEYLRTCGCVSKLLQVIVTSRCSRQPAQIGGGLQAVGEVDLQG